jgi:hypothetical protein
VQPVSTLRKIVVRRLIPVWAAVAVAVPGLLLVGSPPANAAGPLAKICEVTGGLCLGAPNLASFDPVVETTSGRDILPKNLGGNLWELQINAAPSECVAANNPGTLVVLHPCANNNGITWLVSQDKDGVSCDFENTLAAKYLSGDGNKHQLTLQKKGTKGWLQAFFGGGFIEGISCAS